MKSKYKVYLVTEMDDSIITDCYNNKLKEIRNEISIDNK